MSQGIVMEEEQGGTSKSSCFLQLDFAPAKKAQVWSLQTLGRRELRTPQAGWQAGRRAAQRRAGLGAVASVVLRARALRRSCSNAGKSRQLAPR